MWPTLLIIGCVVGLSQYPTSPTEVETGTAGMDSAVPDTDSAEPVEPEPSERNDIWIYTGHGGAGVANPAGRGGLASIQDHWQNDGASTTVLSELPDIGQMAQPKLLVLAAPGIRTPLAFGALDVRKIETFLESDGLLAIYIESCVNPHLDTLMSQLGLGIQMSSIMGGSDELVHNAVLHASSPFTTGIERLSLNAPCRLTVSTATVLASIEQSAGSEVFIASGPTNYGGEAIVLGDLQLIDDAGHLEEADNRLFASGIASRVPETVP